MLSNSSILLRGLYLAVLLLLSAANASLAQQYPKGVIIDTVYCTQDSSQSYALYLPSNYNPQQTWPIIFIFEPAARGKLPVVKFQPGAEELGYILVGSNNSRNGSWEVAFDAADAMFLDVLNKLSVDPERVYTSGFSGGSRVATSVAVITGKIAGVIACGAGYPNVREYQPSSGSKLIYNALVGNQDMNYQEHLNEEQDLNSKGIANNLIIFPSGHQWPASSFLKEALYWNELQAYKQGKKVNSTFKPMQAYVVITKRADSIYNAQDLVSALKIYRSIEQDFEGLISTQEIKDLISQISQSKAYKKQQRNDNRINDEELRSRFKLGEAFTELSFTRLKTAGDSSLKDIAWWHSEIDHWKRVAKKDDIHKRNMALRLLNMIWARCAEASFEYASNHDYELALILNDIWLYTEPHNTWGHWSIAKLYAQTGEIGKVLKHLKAVAEYRPGLPTKAIKSDPVFRQIIDTEEMQNLLNESQ